jgi:hypothetical protein
MYRDGLRQCEESKGFLVHWLATVSVFARTVVTGVSEEQTC